MEITKENLKNARDIINKHMKLAADELGLTFTQIGSITFTPNNFRFKVEMFKKGTNVDAVKANPFVLATNGLTIGQKVTAINGKEFTLAGTTRSKLIITDETGKRYTCKPEYLRK